jgi:preprotein translocase subunit Sec63
VLQQEEEARDREADAQQRQAEEALHRSQHDVASQDEFDPYTVLGVARGASKEDIGVAYQAAKLKYDPDQVMHLSVDVQDHFKTKALAVERAYLNLSESP